MSDTDPEIERRYRQRLMGLSPAQRLIMAGSMFATARVLVESGIRRDHPTIGAADLRREILQRTYHPDFPPMELARIVATLR